MVLQGNWFVQQLIIIIIIIIIIFIAFIAYFNIKRYDQMRTQFTIKTWHCTYFHFSYIIFLGVDHRSFFIVLWKCRGESEWSAF